MANFGALGTLRNAYQTLIKPSTSALLRSRSVTIARPHGEGPANGIDYSGDPPRKNKACFLPSCPSGQLSL